MNSNLERIEPFLSQAKRISEEFFGLKLQIQVDLETDNQECGEYDFKTDKISIYLKFIEHLVKVYDKTSLEEVVEHTVCHEYAHGNDARQFAKNSIFPYTIQISERSVMTFDSNRLKTNLYKDGIAYLINTIQDYAIDKKLHKRGLIDHTIKNRVAEIKYYESNKPKNKTELLQRQLQMLFSLPFDVHSFNLGKLEDKSHDSILRYSNSIIGKDIWDEASTLLEKQTYGDIDEYCNTTRTLLSRLLNTEVEWRLANRTLFETDFKLPGFWNQKQFKVLYID